MLDYPEGNGLVLIGTDEKGAVLTYIPVTEILDRDGKHMFGIAESENQTERS